jgi:hypothetical protein
MVRIKWRTARLETLIGTDPFLVRAIENFLDRRRQWSR